MVNMHAAQPSVWHFSALVSFCEQILTITLYFHSLVKKKIYSHIHPLSYKYLDSTLGEETHYAHGHNV